MDNQTHSSESLWVDDRLAGLEPSAEWRPDTNRALQRFMQRREKVEAEGSGRWIRLSMAAAIVVSIGLVVSLLPWHAFWKGPEGKKSMTPELAKAAIPAVAPAPAPAPPALTQAPAPSLEQRQKPEEHVETNDSDEARRAHIQGAVAAVQQTAPPPPEQEQKPAEHLGPGVTAPRALPPMPEPQYTDEARRAKIQGNVVLSVIIRADGTGKFEKVVQGLGYGLDEKAVEAFEKWRFTPGMKDGKSVDVQLQVTFGFHLY